MAPGSRIILALLGITSAGLVLCAALIYGSLDRLSLRTAEANIDFLLTQIRNTIEANVDLGLPLADIRLVQDLIERAQASDQQIVALEVFSPAGISLFNTDRGSIGEPVSPTWREAVRYRVENDRWRVEELGDIVVGQVIRNDFGEPVGYLAISLSGEPRRQRAQTILAGLAQQGTVTLPVALALVLLVAAGVLNLSSLDVKLLAQRVISGQPAIAPPSATSGLVREADRALMTVERAVADFEHAAREVAQIDESENRDAA